MSSTGHTHYNGGFLQKGMIIFFDTSIGGAITDPANRTTDLSSDLGDAFKGIYVCNGKTTTDRVKNVTLPDLTNRFIRCAMSSGATGGSDTHTLTIDEMPAHSHKVYMAIDVANGTNEYGVVNPSTADYHPTETVGGGSAHENRPAYHELIPIMRVIP